MKRARLLGTLLLVSILTSAFTAVAVQACLGGDTPGFWKNRGLTLGWPAPYTPSTSFASVFGRDPPPGRTTLLACLQGGGGPGIDGASRCTVPVALRRVQ